MSQAFSQDVDPSLFGPESELPTHQKPAGGLNVRFYQRPVLNVAKSWGDTIREQDAAGNVTERKTEGAGREIYDLVDFVQIRIPGDKLLVQDTPVRMDHKQRFPDLWRAYVASKSEQGTEATGTPLEMAPFLNAAQVEELKYQRIRTVEQLASVSDGALSSLGMGMRQHRDKAQAWLEAAKGAAPALQAKAEAEAARQEVAVLKAQLAEMARLNEKAAEKQAKSK